MTPTNAELPLLKRVGCEDIFQHHSGSLRYSSEQILPNPD